MPESYVQMGVTSLMTTLTLVRPQRRFWGVLRLLMHAQSFMRVRQVLAVLEQQQTLLHVCDVALAGGQCPVRQCQCGATLAVAR